MNKICRICLEEGVLSSMFTRNFNLSMSDMIEYCCNIQIRKNDGLPEQLCSNCMYKLGIAYHFKQTCENAEARLRGYLGLNKPPKCADASVMTDPYSATVTIRKCLCKQKQHQKTSSNYKRKPESEKLKRGPKPKPKQVNACFQCDKEFRCQAQLDIHVRTHTGDQPFICMYCPRKFSQKHNLMIHLRVHTGEKPFQCEICSKRFTASGNLQTHIKIHTGQRDHACSICKKTFITSTELTRHLCRHRGVKDYKCTICASAFVQFRDLRIHQEKKHNIVSVKENKTVSAADDKMKIKTDEIDIEDVSISGMTGPLNESLVLPKVSNIHQNSITQDTKTEISFEESKERKLLSNHYPHDKGQPNIVCSLCGEGFEYMPLLAHHYSHTHKDYPGISSSHG